MKANGTGPKEGAKKRQAAFTERQKLAGLLKWQKWVTPTEADALDALLSQLRAGQAPNVRVEPLAEGKSARTRCSAAGDDAKG